MKSAGPPSGRLALRKLHGANTSAADGLNWSLKAITDARDTDPGAGFPTDFDFGACDTLTEVFDTTCSAALNDDDSDNSDNTRQRDFPLVKFVP